MKKINYGKKAEAWIAKTAKKNGVSREDVLRYLRELLSPKKVLSHLQIF